MHRGEVLHAFSLQANLDLAWMKKCMVWKDRQLILSVHFTKQDAVTSEALLRGHRLHDGSPPQLPWLPMARHCSDTGLQ